MKHLGDITKICGADIEPVDVIIGGSPCQDLSVAGKRAGLDGERSGLFMEQIRIIKEMRDADKLRHTDAVSADCGEGGTTTIESGITQHRLCGASQHVRPRYMVWENVPGAFSSNKAEDFRIVLEETARVADGNAVIPRPPKNKWATAGCIMGDGWSVAWRVLDAQFWGVPQRRRRIALVADFGGQSAPEILFEREVVPGDIAESGTEGQGVAADAVGGTDGSVGVEYCCSMITGQQLYAWEDMANPLKARDYKDPAIVAYSFQRSDELKESQVASTQSASRYKSPTDLVAAVDCRNLNETGETFGTLQAKPNGGQSLNYSGAVRSAQSVRRLTPLECERLQGFPDNWTDISPQAEVTAEDLIFWRTVWDEWDDMNGKKRHTDKQIVKWLKSEAADSARYKALGNSIALPPWRFVLYRIRAQGAVTMGSLFDGIGGFPLIWNESGGQTLWASEIEPFCIAVTKHHFTATR